MGSAGPARRHAPAAPIGCFCGDPRRQLPPSRRPLERRLLRPRARVSGLRSALRSARSPSACLFARLPAPELPAGRPSARFCCLLRRRARPRRSLPVYAVASLTGA